MIWLLGGYFWLYVHRPFEIWPILGLIQFERGYMLLLLVFWLVWPGKTFTASRLHLGILGLFVTMWVSWMLSPYAYAGDSVIESYEKVMVFYLLLTTAAKTELDLRRLMGAFSLAYGVYILHSLREYMGGRYGFAQGVQRMMGVDVTFGDPNQFATAILLSLPMVLAYLTTTRGFWRVLLIGQMVATGVCIFLTCSRAGIVGMGFFLFLAVCFSKRRVLGFTLLLVLCVLVMALLPGYVYNRIMTLVDAGAGPEIAQNSAAGRLAGFLKGVELLQAYPLSGVGPAAFALASGKGFQAHNLYGQVAGELGLLGILAFGFLVLGFFAYWRQAGRIVREHPHLKDSVAFRRLRGVGMGVLLLLLNGMAGHTLYRYNWVWLAAFAVVALRVLQEQAHAAAVAQTYPTWEPLPDEGVEPRPGYAPA